MAEKSDQMEGQLAVDAKEQELSILSMRKQ
jgi:hypothetical protein